MDDFTIRQKIFLDLFVTPQTMIPTMAGATSMLAGWAIGSSTLMFAGFVGLLFAAGTGMFRFLFSLGEVTEQAAKSMQTRALMEEKKELDKFDRKLTRNKDPRDQGYLRSLRTIYMGFVDDLQKDKISSLVTSQMISELNDMFKKYVSLLEHSYEIWENARSMKGDLRDKTLQQREDILNEVGLNVEVFSDTVNRLRALRVEDKKSDVTEAQRRLTKQLEIAERTQAQMKDLKTGDIDRFAEFTQEAQ